MFSIKKQKDDLQWQEIMFQAIRSLHSRGKLSATECGKLAGSVVAEINTHRLIPYHLFNSYQEYRRFLANAPLPK